MSKMIKIAGASAIRLAERDGLTIHCYANPIDDGGIVSLDAARQIAKEDESLIYVEVAAPAKNTDWLALAADQLREHHQSCEI